MPLLDKLEPRKLKERLCLFWWTKGEMGFENLEVREGVVMAGEATPNSLASIEKKERA